MLLFMAFAVYTIITRRVKITRSFVLSGEKAREYGILLLALILPVNWVVVAVLNVILPRFVLQDASLRRLIVLALMGGFTIVLALPFRDAPLTGPPEGAA
jgi:hypothetical protein